MRTVQERLQHYALRIGGHLIWCGAFHSYGYGALRVDGKLALAHRLAYEIWVGPIPKGRWVLHRCNTPPCIEPTHLYLGTRSDNTLDAVRAGNHNTARKTHCPRGHPYSDENTYRYPSGRRECRTCRWERERGY